MASKVILTNGGALRAKYGAKAADVRAAVDTLIAADKRRGINSELVDLDDASGVAGGQAVTRVDDDAQAKRAVDAVVGALSPDYLLLLGGPDVIPHYALDNPASDEDMTVPSDLPFASDAGPSRTASDFLGATRMVSRLPDVPGASDPEVFLEIIGVAANWQSRPASEYAPYLGISAEVWEASTRLSLTQLFGAHSDLKTSPADGPAWSAAQIGRRSQFVNCHGAPATPDYFGQRGTQYPVAHEASFVDRRLSEGVVLAVECCYGAEIYRPVDGRLGMPLTYLRSGAYGVFGSTTIAYGPADSNASADDMCRFFLASVLSGSTVGRSGLEARQRFVAGNSPMDPVDLKTLAQFLILGDVSTQPVRSTATPQKAAGVGYAMAVSESRSVLRERGSALAEIVAYAEPTKLEVSAGVEAVLRQAAQGFGPGEATLKTFQVRGGLEAKGMRAAFVQAGGPVRMYLLVRRLEAPAAPMRPHIAIVATEEAGLITGVRTLISR